MAIYRITKGVVLVYNSIDDNRPALALLPDMLYSTWLEGKYVVEKDGVEFEEIEFKHVEACLERFMDLQIIRSRTKLEAIAGYLQRFGNWTGTQHGLGNVLGITRENVTHLVKMLESLGRVKVRKLNISLKEENNG